MRAVGTNVREVRKGAERLDEPLLERLEHEARGHGGVDEVGEPRGAAPPGPGDQDRSLDAAARIAVQATEHIPAEETPSPEFSPTVRRTQSVHRSTDPTGSVSEPAEVTHLCDRRTSAS